MPEPTPQYYRGDNIPLEFQLFRDAKQTIPWDITDYEIRFELSSLPSAVKKATENVSGGANEQIEITDATEGKFIVRLLHDDTKDITPAAYYYEIEITSPDAEKFTVARERIEIVKDVISWDSL